MKKQVIILIRNANAYDFGGGERFPVYLAEALQKNNLHPLIVSRSKKLRDFAKSRKITSLLGPWWSFQDWSGWKLIFLPAYTLWQLFLTFWYLILFLKNRPKAVHIQSKDDFISATIAAKLVGVRIVWTDHADLKHIWKNIDIWYRNPTGHMIYWTSRLADDITVVSRSELDKVSANLPKKSNIKSKLTVIYNGCADMANAYPHQKHDGFVYCLAGRIVTDKGVGEAIEAFRSVRSNYRDTRLHIIGDGPEMNKFKEIARGVDGITFLGHMNEPFDSIVNCDVFLLPTYHEGFSVALVEASMLGMPIIATEVGGNIEIISNEQTGLLVPAKDPAALTDAMNKLYRDEGLRNKLASNARQQYLERFVFDNIIKERFIPIYEKNID